jgi:hypothetical protein
LFLTPLAGPRPAFLALAEWFGDASPTCAGVDFIAPGNGV